MAKIWILMRHPDKAGDKEGVYLGDTAEITELGQRQIPLVTSRLKLLQPEAVTCSVYPRAVTLAKRVAEDLNLPQPVPYGLFNEIDKPKFLVGLKRTDPLHVEVMQAIRDGWDDDTVPTHLLRGEKIKTRTEVEESMRKTFSFIEGFRLENRIEPTSIVTVSHAKKIAAILHWLLNDETLVGYYRKADRRLKISTTGITILVREPCRRTGEMLWQVKTINEEAHTEIGAEEKLRSLIRKLD